MSAAIKEHGGSVLIVVIGVVVAMAAVLGIPKLFNAIKAEVTG